MPQYHGGYATYYLIIDKFADAKNIMSEIEYSFKEKM